MGRSEAKASILDKTRQLLQGKKGTNPRRAADSVRRLALICVSEVEEGFLEEKSYWKTFG